jgi:hypothetical protein
LSLNVCLKSLLSLVSYVPFVLSRFSFLYSHDQYHKYYLHKLAQYSEQPGRTAAGLPANPPLLTLKRPVGGVMCKDDGVDAEEKQRRGTASAQPNMLLLVFTVYYSR